ncbi:MAG TPA: DUF2497 domain-containing protein [Methylocella sp.]|nr:DUF2497 domain-containing protein [Methylocella sp.]
MSAATQLTNDVPDPEPLNEPSMVEILASIRRIIADGQAFSAGQEETGGDLRQPAEDIEKAAPELCPAPSDEKSPPLASPETGNSVNAAFNALLASRLARQSDVIIALIRDMLRPMVKSWLDENLPRIVERLVSAEIERMTKAE